MLRTVIAGHAESEYVWTALNLLRLGRSGRLAFTRVAAADRDTAAERSDHDVATASSRFGQDLAEHAQGQVQLALADHQRG
jgi:hypothetical protein